MASEFHGYEPNAIAIYTGYGKNKGKFERRFTYDSCRSLEEAQKCIETWRNSDYILLCSWIVHTWDRRKVDVRIYEEAVQSLEWGGAVISSIPEKLLNKSEAQMHLT